jgi:hypothetical protein
MVKGLDLRLININQVDKTGNCKRLTVVKRSTHAVPDKENSTELRFFICNHYCTYSTNYLQDHIDIDGHNKKTRVIQQQTYIIKDTFILIRQLFLSIRKTQYLEKTIIISLI